MFLKTGVPRKVANFTGKLLCWNFFFGTPFLQNTPDGCFCSYNFHNTFYEKHLLLADSAAFNI